ncbi:MAG TPA: carbohydrate kinase [Solirubrobacteraceae bacterium]|nr:carbohydrate kinase [Solirubrobacteraceae bacterium]
MTPRTGVIAVVGEALVDLVLEPDGNAATHLGGGSFNAARTLGRLGLQPLFVGRLSRDSYGRALRAGLEESGVRLDGIIDTSDPTTFARVEVDADGVASYRFYIDGTSAPGLLPSDARAVMPAAPAAIHVGGLGLVLEPHASTIATLVAGAAPSTLVFVDPNCRPAAIADPLAYRRRLAAILARADVVKVSRDDLAWLEPDLPPLHAARRWLDRGPALILLTDGKRGATVLASAGHLHIDGVRAEVIDTIGAGDAFGAAWLGAWVTDDLGPADLTDLYAVVRAARFASLIAARTCERPGAEPPRAVKVGPEWCVAGITPGTTSLAE